MSEFSLDAAYAIALASSRDQCHQRAVELAHRIQTENIPLITTRAVMLEIGNSLSKSRLRSSAVVLLEALESDPNVNIIPVDEPLFHRAFELFRARQDKEWGLTDCISFVVMTDHNITDALTTDDDFRQAGFKPLLI